MTNRDSKISLKKLLTVINGPDPQKTCQLNQENEFDLISFSKSVSFYSE